LYPRVFEALTRLKRSFKLGVVSDAQRCIVLPELKMFGIQSPFNYAKVALVDPEMTMTCPPKVTASSGMDVDTYVVVEGPGVPEKRGFAICGLFPENLALVHEANEEFPLGVDVIL
ncbi:phosphonate C-P lyase system protein PhnH, partial [Acetomicrobium sp. S15 = DSM 107314]|uniref:phosphonate C-P lyase system protein PhnH n=1 Tax=Acetomicrobium sp. S15 = DSM 107314 TaxID=2529858 RepID=UPI0018E0F057